MISFMITTGSLNSQDMIRILKQWRHDFLGKHLCDGYCMDIMWCVGIEFKIQNSTEGHMVLFECRGPWILKTDSLIF